MKYELKDVEIFASGEWNGDKYTEVDLQELVRGFKDTFTALQPYVKLGHNNDQTILAKDGLPAAGWIHNLKIKGNKLLADITGVPKKVYELIKNGAYKRVSSEIFFDITVAGKKYPKLLKAIALLGADTPAVQTLDDILALYGLEGTGNTKAYEFNVADITAIETTGGSKVEKLLEMLKMLSEKAAAGESITPEAGKEFFAEFRKHCNFEIDKAESEVKAEQERDAALTEKAAAEKLLTEKEAELKTLTDQNAELSEKIFSAEVDKKIDELITGKKITPAQRDYVKSIITGLKSTGNTRKFKFGDTEKTLEEVFFAFTSTLDVNINTEGQTGAGEAKLSDEPDEKGFTGSQLDKEVKKYMADNKVDYKSALLRVTEIRKKK